MPDQRQIERAMKLPARYHLMRDNQRTLLCHRGKTPCLTRFRIKELEPGVFARVCPSCNTTSWFQLTVTHQRHATTGLPYLKFGWLTRKEADELASASLAECLDLGISRNT